MELQEARAIVNTLAQGVHPVTGEVMPDDSPYNAPSVIRALVAVSQALDHLHERPRRESPPNAGKPWTADEDAMLDAVFASGGDLKPLAQALGRTLFAVESRLVKLGKMPPRSGMRISAPSPA
ncbi:MAG: hypothetical protein ABI409_20255 [Ramlibacter sp.]